MKQRAYQCCSRCVMDTSDPEIRFDKSGVCNHCTEFIRTKLSFANSKPNPLKKRKADLLILPYLIPLT